MHRFDVVYSKSCFSRQMINFNCASFFKQSNPRLKIKNRDHPRPFFDALKLIVTSDLAKGHGFKIAFYEVTLNTLFLVKN